MKPGCSKTNPGNFETNPGCSRTNPSFFMPGKCQVGDEGVRCFLTRCQIIWEWILIYFKRCRIASGRCHMVWEVERWSPKGVRKSCWGWLHNVSGKCLVILRRFQMVSWTPLGERLSIFNCIARVWSYHGYNIQPSIFVMTQYGNWGNIFKSVIFFFLFIYIFFNWIFLNFWKIDTHLILCSSIKKFKTNL